MLDARDYLPWLAGLVMFLVGFYVTQRRADTVDDEQDRWRQVLQAERDKATRDARRWQRYAQEIEIATALLWTEWEEWGQSMTRIARRCIKPDETTPLPPNKSSVRWPKPPNGGTDD